MLLQRGLAAITTSSLLAFLSSTIAYHPQLFLLTLFLHVFLVSYMIDSLLRMRSITSDSFIVRREVSHNRVIRGSVIEVSARVRSKIDEPIKVEVRDRPPFGLIIVDGTTLSQAVLKPDEEITVKYKARISCTACKLSFRYVLCVVSDPLGLVGKQVRINSTQEVLVVSEELVYGHESITLRRRSTSSSPGIGINPFTGLDYEYMGIRPYELGDRIRDIHWKRMAAQQDEEAVIVKRFEKRSESQINIVIDCSPSINAGIGESYLDDVLRISALIAIASIEEGNALNVYVLNPALSAEEVLDAKVRSEEELLTRLSNVYPSYGLLDHGLVKGIGERLARGSSVIIFTNPPSPNQRVVEEIISHALDTKCIVSIIMPNIIDYYGRQVDETIKEVIALDAMYKEGWLKRLRGARASYITPKGATMTLEQELGERGWTREPIY